MFGEYPNMGGRFSGLQGTSNPSGSGSFTYLNGSTCYGTSPGNWKYGSFEFDPSTVASEYVDNGKLQASALQVLACIKA